MNTPESTTANNFKPGDEVFVFVDGPNGDIDWEPAVFREMVEDDWARVVMDGKPYTVPIRTVKKDRPGPPPLGLMPRNIWVEKTFLPRLADVDAAIERYLKARMPIPKAWMKERNDLLKALSGGKGGRK